jgi:tetratricopeptide (TPR) repeat protein
VVSLVAWGGVGKSTLVNKWLEALKADNWRGAQRVLGWSFFSQGTGERVTSADQFINHALRFFNDPEPEAGSPWAKGQRLADLARRDKALLILDGLEPLQDRYQGIKDPALQRLVEELARENTGLCVITTREAVKELEDFSASALACDLEQISPEAGRALLRVKGVRGTDTELEQASAAFGNHALAINLLASWLRAIPGHPIAQAATIPERPDLPESSRQPRRVMAAFAVRFGADSAEVEVLRLLGLFDRPATKAAIDALTTKPAIPGLTDRLVVLNESGWQGLLARLRATGMIAPRRRDSPELEKLDRWLAMGLVPPASLLMAEEIDAHPLLREHFGAELREAHPEVWRAGHARLYEYFRELPEKHQPDTLEEMAPLFQAVFHGCEAGRAQNALYDVWWERINRREKAYQIKKLGALGADLAALAGFFDPPWDRPVASITEEAKAMVLAAAGFDLGALGRLEEAIPTVQASVAMYETMKHWMEAANRAANLSELQLTLGELAEAITLAERAAAYADRSGHAFARMVGRATQAEAWHQAGEAKRAKALFEEAESLQIEREPKYPRLYSHQGYLYCDLLLDLGRHAEVRERARQTLEWGKIGGQGSLLTIALELLSLGRAEFLAHEADRSGDLAAAQRYLNEAVDDLRKAGQIQELPGGLLARAAYYRVTEQIDRARRDLIEAMRIATRSGMRLRECDAHLELGRLELAQGRREAARPHLARAEELVVTTGYHRRDKDLAELKAALG